MSDTQREGGELFKIKCIWRTNLRKGAVTFTRQKEPLSTEQRRHNGKTREMEYSLVTKIPCPGCSRQFGSSRWVQLTLSPHPYNVIVAIHGLRANRRLKYCFIRWCRLFCIITLQKWYVCLEHVLTF